MFVDKANRVWRPAIGFICVLGTANVLLLLPWFHPLGVEQNRDILLFITACVGIREYGKQQERIAKAAPANGYGGYTTPVQGSETVTPTGEG